MSGIADILDRAADRLSKHGAWIVGSYAAKADGTWCRTGDPAATCFCMVGAIAAERGDGPGSTEAWLEHFHPKTYRLLSGRHSTPSGWNDRHSGIEVVAKLREAAAKARGETA